MGQTMGANDGGELSRARLRELDYLFKVTFGRASEVRRLRPHSSPPSFAPIVRPSIIKQPEGALEAYAHVLSAGHAGKGAEVHEVGAHAVTQLGIPIEVFY